LQASSIKTVQTQEQLNLTFSYAIASPRLILMFGQRENIAKKLKNRIALRNVMAQIYHPYYGGYKRYVNVNIITASNESRPIRTKNLYQGNEIIIIIQYINHT